MDKNLQIPGMYIVRFETASVVPGPFAHYYSLRLDIRSEDELQAAFELVYKHREELTDEEIFDEGFTKEDDYNWKGQLPAIWISEFKEIFSSSKLIRKRDDSEYEDFVEIELEEDNKRVTVYPVDKERWTYFLQELMQAIFETGGREKAFELSYLDIAGDDQSGIDLVASFSRKTFTVSRHEGKTVNLEWSQLQNIMDTVYRAEFVADNALTSQPKKRGKYLSAGDGLWYQLGVAVLETSSKSKDLQKIEALFNTLAAKLS